MIDFVAIQRAIYTWLTTVTDLPVLWGFDKQPQPEIRDGFCSVSITALTLTPAQGDDEVTYVETGGELYAQLNGAREMTLNIQAFSASQAFDKHAFNTLSKVQGALHSAPDLDAAGLTFIRDTGITNISNVAGNGYESRASMDVTFTVPISTVTAESAAGWFNSAVINGKQIGPP